MVPGYSRLPSLRSLPWAESTFHRAWILDPGEFRSWIWRVGWMAEEGQRRGLGFLGVRDWAVFVLTVLVGSSGWGLGSFDRKRPVFQGLCVDGGIQC